MRINEKKMSIYVIIILRFITSIIFFISSYILKNMLFEIGEIKNIGLNNAITFMIIISLLFTTLIILSSATKHFSDPFNFKNVHKYRIILLLQIITMIIISYIFATYDLNIRIKVASDVALVTIGTIVLIIHISIIRKYKTLEVNEVDRIIQNHKLPVDKELIGKVSVIKVKLFYLFIYIIVCGSRIEWILYNHVTIIIASVIYIIIVKKLFSKALLDLNNYIEIPENTNKTLLYGSVFPTLGIIAVYLLYKGHVYIPIISETDTNALFLIWILSFIPFIKKLLENNDVILRMDIMWER